MDLRLNNNEVCNARSGPSRALTRVCVHPTHFCAIARSARFPVVNARKKKKDELADCQKQEEHAKSRRWLIDKTIHTTTKAVQRQMIYTYLLHFPFPSSETCCRSLGLFRWLRQSTTVHHAKVSSIVANCLLPLPSARLFSRAFPIVFIPCVEHTQ